MAGRLKRSETKISIEIALSSPKSGITEPKWREQFHHNRDDQQDSDQANGMQCSNGGSNAVVSPNQAHAADSTRRCTQQGDERINA
jgi:hypothetical protein